MKKYNLISVFTMMISIAVMFSSCRAIGEIFKAGMWVGVIIVVVIIAVIFWIINKARK